VVVAVTFFLMSLNVQLYYNTKSNTIESNNPSHFLVYFLTSTGLVTYFGA